MILLTCEGELFDEVSDFERWNLFDIHAEERQGENADSHQTCKKGDDGEPADLNWEEVPVFELVEKVTSLLVDVNLGSVMNHWLKPLFWVNIEESGFSILFCLLR